MPGFNGTGPRGQGPITGGARGFCAVPLGSGRHLPYGGRFFGRGRGRGFRNRYWATGLPGWIRANQETVPEEDLNTLKDYAEHLKEELAGTEDRIVALEKSGETFKGDNI